MTTYPIRFDSQAKTEPGIQTKWQSVALENTIDCCIPKDFSGPGGGLSPEDLYLLAIQNCFIGTFKVFAEHSRLLYDSLEVRSTLVVDKDESAKPWMDAIHLIINVSGATDEKKLKLLINKTLENGFILRSVKTKITSEINIL